MLGFGRMGIRLVKGLYNRGKQKFRWHEHAWACTFSWSCIVIHIIVWSYMAIHYGCPIKEVYPTFKSLCMEIHLVHENIYRLWKYILCAKTFIWVHKIFSLHGNISKSSCGNLWLCKHFILCRNIKFSCGNLLIKLMCCVEIFSSPCKCFICVQKLLCPMCRFWASNHFRNAVMPWLANW